MRAVLVVAIAWGSSRAWAAPSTADVKQVTTGAGATCVLHVDGAVSCWGSNDHGQLASPDPAPRLTPVDVPSLRRAEQLGGVGAGMCGRFSDGTVKCFGVQQGPLQQGGLQPLADIVELRGDCVVDKAGRAWCSSLRSGAWEAIPGIADAISIDGSAQEGCALHADGTASCWGRDLAGAPVLGAKADGTAQRIAGVTKAVELAVGLSQACVRERSGHVTCWGSNMDGALGRGTIEADSSYPYRRPARVIGLGDATKLQAVGTSTCAIRKSGALVCWGQWSWVRGVDAKRAFPRPTPVPGLPPIRGISGADHYCAVAKGREVLCWGDGKQGQLGLGYAEQLSTPRDVPKIDDAIAVHALALATCVLRKTGAITCFGDDPPRAKAPPRLATLSSFHDRLAGLDRAGKLWISGDPAAGTIAGTSQEGACVVTRAGKVTCRAAIMYQRSRTGTVGNVTDAVEVRGETNICIRHATGKISCLGIADALHGGEAVEVPAITDAIALAAGTEEMCAVRADRSVWCWGKGDSMFLGARPDASASRAPNPIAPFRVPGVRDAAAISIGRDHTPSETACVVTTQGRVTCWGVPNPTYKGVLAAAGPVEIRGIDDAVQVSVGWLHACAVRKTGAVACWGQTGNGQTGTAPTDRVETPQPVQWK